MANKPFMIVKSLERHCYKLKLAAVEDLMFRNPTLLRRMSKYEKFTDEIFHRIRAILFTRHGLFPKMKGFRRFTVRQTHWIEDVLLQFNGQQTDGWKMVLW